MYCISSYHALSQRFFLLKPLTEDKAWRPWGDTKCWVTFSSFHDVYLIPHQKLAALRKKIKNKNKHKKPQPFIFSDTFTSTAWSDAQIYGSPQASSYLPERKTTLPEQKKSLLDVQNQYSLLQVGIIMRGEYWFAIDAPLRCTDFLLFPHANCIS